MILELCCADISSVQLAEKLKIPAIELCIDLACGGLTPSLSLVKLARKVYSGELAVLIRCRKGNFCYSELEKSIMLNDMQYVISLGADAIVFGALTPENNIDTSFLEQVINNTYGNALCFHKAFDHSQHLQDSLSILTEYEIDRVLTSGGYSTALEGINSLSALQQLSNHSIEIMAGGSIDATSVHTIVSSTGIQRIHAALLDEEINYNQYGSKELPSIERLELLIDSLKLYR